MAVHGDISVCNVYICIRLCVCVCVVCMYVCMCVCVCGGLEGNKRAPLEGFVLDGEI